MWRLLPVLLVGCYAPELHEGVPCGTGGTCPAELRCSPATNTCEQTVTMVDAPVLVDAAIDARPDSSCTGMMTFNYTGSIVNFDVPSCANAITIEAWGAQGGGGTIATFVGGKGAHIMGTFENPPAKLKILVGGKGIAAANTNDERGGTGGGGSFVASMTNTPLLVAGGGGGAVGDGFAAKNGGDGQITINAQDGGGGVLGGTSGNGGTTYSNLGFHAGTGAGGFLTDGSADSNGTVNGTPNGRGKAFVNGGAGGTAGSAGRAGGFGGGGAAGFTGGGGGGYSGGASSGNDATADHSGGGGGSYNACKPGSEVAEPGINTGDGKIIIRW